LNLKGIHFQGALFGPGAMLNNVYFHRPFTRGLDLVPNPKMG